MGKKLGVKLLVTGGKGQLAQEIYAEFLNSTYMFASVTLASRETLDITSQEQVKSFLGDWGITHVINTAAYTAVDKAEEEPGRALQVNMAGARNLAIATRQLGVDLLHISTDFVFDGCKKIPYLESDTPNPLGVYGRTKLYGEVAVFSHNPKALVVRTGWLYSAHGNNFVKTILRLSRVRDEIRVVADQMGTPTYARDLARCLLELLSVDRKGTNLLHYSNEGVTSWHGFAEAIVELAGLATLEEKITKVIPITTENYPTPAKRPKYSVLDKSRIKKLLSNKIPHWKDSLRECLAEFDTIRA